MRSEYYWIGLDWIERHFLSHSLWMYSFYCTGMLQDFIWFVLQYDTVCDTDYQYKTVLWHCSFCSVWHSIQIPCVITVNTVQYTLLLSCTFRFGGKLRFLIIKKYLSIFRIIILLFYQHFWDMIKSTILWDKEWQFPAKTKIGTVRTVFMNIAVFIDQNLFSYCTVSYMHVLRCTILYTVPV